MNVIDVLMYGQRTIVRTLERYGPDEWSRTAVGVWTSKDLLGHLGAFEVRFADVLATVAGAPADSGLMDADPRTFNDDQAAIRASWTIEAVIEEFLTAHARVMTHARAIPAERWREVGTIPWYGLEYALDDLLVYQMYGHKREHDPQLGAVLDARG
jgi:hypothetical protein